MPTKYRRIAVTNDPELASALERVSHLFDGVPTATIVRELALKGAEALDRDARRREEAIERLIAFSHRQRDLIDWDYLERIDELGWGH